MGPSQNDSVKLISRCLCMSTTFLKPIPLVCGCQEEPIKRNVDASHSEVKHCEETTASYPKVKNK